MKHSTKKGRRALSLLLCLVFAWTLAPVQAFAAGTYDPTDVDAVNKIIEENGLQAEKMRRKAGVLPNGAMTPKNGCWN